MKNRIIIIVHRNKNVAEYFLTTNSQCLLLLYENIYFYEAKASIVNNLGEKMNMSTYTSFPIAKSLFGY